MYYLLLELRTCNNLTNVLRIHDIIYNADDIGCYIVHFVVFINAFNSEKQLQDDVIIPAIASVMSFLLVIFTVTILLCIALR